MKFYIMTLCMLCFPMLTIAEEEPVKPETDPKVQRILDEFAKSLEKGEAIIAEAEAERDEVVLKGVKEARKDLKRLIRRSDDLAFQAAVYRELLRFDPTDEEAVAFFTQIGALDNIMDNLNPVVNIDLLGNIVVTDDSLGGTKDALTGFSFRKNDGRLSYRFEEGSKLVMIREGKPIGIYAWRSLTPFSFEVAVVEPATWHANNGFKKGDIVGVLLLIDPDTLQWKEGNPAQYIRIK